MNQSSNLYYGIQLITPFILAMVTILAIRVINLVVIARLAGTATPWSKLFREPILRSLASFGKTDENSILSDGSKLQVGRVVSYAALIPISLLPLTMIPICEPILQHDGRVIFEIVQSNYTLLLVAGAIIISSLYHFIVEYFATPDASSNPAVSKMGSEFICYQVVFCLLVLSTVAIYLGFDLHAIVQRQMGLFTWRIPMWGIWQQPLGALLLFILIVMHHDASGTGSRRRWETPLHSAGNPSMFESVIVSLSREINLVVLSALFVTLFLGGYDLLPGMWWLSSKLEILYYPMQFFSLLIKVVIMTVIIQISSISLIKVKLSSQIKFFWHHLIPLGIINLMLVVGMIIIRSTI